MIVIFVEFIDQLIDYPINRASPRKFSITINHSEYFDVLPLILLNIYRKSP